MLQHNHFYSTCFAKSSASVYLFGMVFFWLHQFNTSVFAQQNNPLSWYKPNQEWFQLVVADVTQTHNLLIKEGNSNFGAMYQVPIQLLVDQGFPNATVEASHLKVFKKGVEIPIYIEKNIEGPLQTGDRFFFYGERNTGKDENWAYGSNGTDQKSTFYSLYSDTTYYWLTWSESPGLRYQLKKTEPTDTFYTGFRDTLINETENISFYYQGYGSFAELSTFGESEGVYFGYDLNLFGLANRQVSFKNRLNDILRVDSTIFFETRLAAASNGSRTVRIQLNHILNGTVAYHSIGSKSWTGRGGAIITGAISPVRLIDYNELDFYFNIINDNPVINTPHIMYFDWYKFSYYRGFTINATTHQFNFWLQSDGQQSIRLRNIAATDTIIVFSPTTRSLFQPKKNTSNLTATFFDDQTSSGKNLYIAVKNQALPAPIRIRKVPNFPDFWSTSNEAKVIILTRPIFQNQAQAYANYRASKSGMPTKVILADHLWQLFGYGVQTPKAIQDFIHYARSTWKTAPEYMFIIADANLQFRNSRLNPTEIPSFGFPSSDTWYGMNQSSPQDWIPRVSVGRLTAKTPADVIAYLAKMSQYETNRAEYELWQKRVTLLSGGFDSTERDFLLEHNQKLGRLVSNSVVAGDTIIIGKQSNQPLDASLRGDLSSVINNGTFILHFYGHSSPDSWDLLTDNPSAYQNQGKLSIVLSLGCYSGLFATSSARVISEQFVMAQNAAIAFVGGAGQGHPSALQNYSDGFYKYIFQDTVRRLGDVDRLGRIDMIQRFSTIPLLDLALTQNTVIIGDPSLEMALPRKPDYRFDFTPIRFTPEQTNVSDSVFTIIPRIRNLGTLPVTNTALQIQHNKPQGLSETYMVSIPPVRTVSEVSIPVKITNADAGQHQFDLLINPQAELGELNLNNNSIGANHFVYSTGVDLIYPTERLIHTSSKPIFKVSSSSIIAPDQFDFELDTLADFSNPIATQRITATSPSVTWQPSVTLKHLTEYFWRAKVVRDNEENWKSANFWVDTTTTGIWWTQRPRAFSENQFSNSLSFVDTSFQFNPVSLSVRTSTLSWSLAGTPAFRNYPASVFVNGEQMGRLKISFFMLVINGLTGEIRNGLDAQGIPRGQHYAVHSGIFTNEGALSKQQFINDLNAITPGDIVILRVRQFYLINNFGLLFTGDDDPLAEALRSVGAFKAAGGTDGSLPLALAPTDGYILFGKKFASVDARDPNQVSEYIVKSRTEVFEADTTYFFNASEGSMTTPLIGPVKKWIRFEGAGNRISPTGKIIVDIYGQRDLNSASVRLLTSNPNGLSSTFSSDLTSINTVQYPYVRLIARLENPDRRAPQLQTLRINYVPLPELSLNAFTAKANTDSLEEGYTYSFTIETENIGTISVDTLILDFIDMYKPSTMDIQTRLLKRDTLIGFSSFLTDTVLTNRIKSSGFSLQTLGQQGNHTLQVKFMDGFTDVLPYNNFYSRNYYVQKDSISPTIEVFVDNRFLPPVTTPITDKGNPNLSYVSSKPVIDIYWKDTNPFLRVQDSTTIEIRVFTSNPLDFQTFTYQNPEVRFVPAPQTGNSNEAYVEFTPDFTAYGDTVITLQIFSRDLSGNIAEDKENGYMLSFRVSQQQGMTSFYPYPNPMSNFTNFAFELQGSDVSSVERLQLKIFTLTGKPVKIVDLLANPFLLNDGRLRIGWNVYRWDGMDDDGDPLATGVYLYHVDFRANGSTIVVNNKNSVEKIVIIR